jgi:hypothetical protein
MKTRCPWGTIQDLVGRFCRVAFGGKRQRGRRFGSGLDGESGYEGIDADIGDVGIVLR